MGRTKLEEMSWVHAVVMIVARLTSPTLSSPAIHELCPHTRFCTEGPVSIFNDSDTRPCCMPCSCSGDCYEFGNCCPDKSSDSIVPQTVSCRTQADIYGQYLDRPVDNYLQIELKVIDFCPEHAYSNHYLQQASQRCLYRLELEDLVFVSDENNRIYLNRFCAECNGVTSFTVWNLYIPCFDMPLLEMSSFNDLTAVIFDTCDVYSKPPADFNLAPMVCSTNIIAECNFTGRWDFYDREIERNCKNHDILFLPYAVSLRDWYANVYCFICNNPRNTPTSSKCDVLDATSYVFSLYPVFTTILKYPERTEWERQHNWSWSGGCTDMDVFDPFTKQCLKLLCPYGTLPTNGKCKTYVETIDHFCLGIIFGVRLTAQQKSVFQTIDARNLANGISQLVQRIFNHLRIDCAFGFWRISDTPTSDICADIIMVSTETCDHLTLLKAIAILTRETTVEATIDGEQLSLPIYVYDNQQWYSQTKYYLIDEGVDCLPISFTNHTVYCPSIEYNPNNIHFESDIASELLNISVRIDEERYRVCLADYKALTMPLISAGCTVTAANRLLFMKALVSLIWFVY